MSGPGTGSRPARLTNTAVQFIHSLPAHLWACWRVSCSKYSGLHSWLTLTHTVITTWLQQRMVPGLSHFYCSSCNNFLITADVTFLAACLSEEEEAKAIPLQAWTGPQGYRSSRLPDLKKKTVCT
jgi:hypothetical protein